MSERSPLWQAIYVLLVSVIVWVVVLVAAWFGTRADDALGHGPLPSGISPRNTYILTILTGALGMVAGGIIILGVRQSKYFARQFAWLTYLLVAGPLLLLLFAPMQRFGADPFLGLPGFLLGIPGRTIVAVALGALFLGSFDLRRLFPGSVSDVSSRSPATSPGNAAVRGLPGRFTPNAWRALSFMQEEAQRI